MTADGRVDLYLYVVEGITYTDSKDKFESEFNKSTFATVDKIDPNAYGVSTVHVPLTRACKTFMY